MQVGKKRAPVATESLTVWEALGEEYWALAGQEPERSYLDAVEKLRQAKAALKENPKSSLLNEAVEAATADLSRMVVQLWHERPRFALCLSGGGIRSASFCLGVLQALSQRSIAQNAEAGGAQLLGELQYLSTVSGGGYIGGWLSAWAARTGSFVDVIKQLGRPTESKLDPEPAPVRYLRNYSSYLSPRLGLFSSDTWALAATVVRNVLLNWLVLLPLLAALIAIPQFTYIALSVSPGVVSAIAAIAVAAVCVAWSVAYIVQDLPSAIDERRTQKAFLVYCLIPLLIANLCLILAFSWYQSAKQVDNPFSTLGVVAFAAVTTALGLLVALYMAIQRRKVRGRWGWIVISAAATIAAAAAGGWLAYPVARLLMQTDPLLYAWLSFPAILLIIGVIQVIVAGLLSDVTSDEDREWWARAGGWHLLVVVGSIVFGGIALIPDALVEHADIHIESFHSARLSLTALLTITGAMLSRSGFYSKSIPALKEAAKVVKGTSLRLKLALAVFLLLAAVLFADLDFVLAVAFQGWVGGNELAARALVIVLLVAVPVVVGFFVNVNKFSLQNMYRLRLIRAFLGASRAGKRRPNRFTDFDPDDNMRMALLSSEPPLHVVNITLNLVGGGRLSWQERKAEPFTVTRLHAGSCRLAYQKTEHYDGDRLRPDEAIGGISLGGAVAISGAAASPNMGYHSSPLLTLIMTLFNARLGAWLANPGDVGRKVWSKGSPTSAVRPFFDEAFGLTTDKNAWVYLSDGGHFENLGLFEMVLRRCRLIVAIDSSADEAFTYEDLGNAVRKIRIDLGIPIEFASPLPTRNTQTKHCALARIRYSCVDGFVKDGCLLYIKPSLNGNESEDVLAYAQAHPAFPHESTTEQWFTESQFESHRRLGFHVVDEITGFREDVLSLRELFVAAQGYLGVMPETCPVPTP